MAVIDSDDPEIGKELQKLESLVSDAGGGVHSDLLIRCRDGGLSLQTKEPMKQGREIIRLARGTLLPCDQYEVNLRGDEFYVTFPKKSALSPLQRSLAETMMNLYTLTGKAVLHKKYSFILTMAAYPNLLEQILSGRNMG